MASQQKKQKKRAEVTGWCPETVDIRFKNMNKNSHTGDWRRDVKVHNVQYKIATVNWMHLPSKKMVSFPGPIPVGMEKLLTKLESAQNRSFNCIPVAVREEFSMIETAYKSSEYEVSVSFSEASYDNFRLLYCRLCTTKQNLKEKFWEKHPDKLPADNVCRKELMRNWDNLNLSWNSQDVLGCILPNDPNHYALINARRFIQRPIQHWQTVHEVKKKAQKSQITLPVAAMNPPSTSGSSSSSTSSTSTALSSKSLSEKTGHRHSQLRQPSIDRMLDHRIDFNGHAPKNQNEELALGHTLKMLHLGANKMISSATVIESYFTSMQTQLEQYEYYKSLNTDAHRKGTIVLPKPITVRLNDHNINDGYEAILSAYQKHNLDSDNPYRIIERIQHWGFIHDATSHWVKELNTVILRAVDDTGNIFKVPFGFNQVPGSLTGEVLCEEIMTQISKVKKVKNNAASEICEALISSSSGNTCTEKLEELHAQLKEAANVMDFESMSMLKTEIQALQEDLSNSNHSTINKNIVIPKPPHYFNIATLKGIDHAKKIIHLVIPSENVPTSICGDSCATNLKANRLVGQLYGISSPQAGCSSHAASGTIRRTTTSQTMNDPDAVLLYTSLRKNLKHFSMSPKSTELLNRALDVLEQNNVHMLVWGGTRMAGFLDGCKQSSSILVPFLDTLVAGKIREEEAAFILSAKGLYTLELFADLHPIFSNQYLHCVDSDKVLSCEVYDVAHRTADKLVDASLLTPKADKIFDSLHTDTNNNVLVTLVDVQDSHTHLLNEKLTRHKTFQSIKDGLLTTRANILQRLHDNIVDQVKEESIFHLLNVFDLHSRESLEDKVEKIKKLSQIFGKEVNHAVADKWFGFDVHLTYKARLRCTEEELLAQFNTGHEKMTSLARELREDRMSGSIKLKLTQHQLWVRFLKDMGMQCPDLCDLIIIMISIPPNSGWVERAYSYLDQVCQKKRNRMDIDKPLKELFFLALLKLKPKDSFGYRKEIEIMSGEA